MLYSFLIDEEHYSKQKLHFPYMQLTAAYSRQNLAGHICCPEEYKLVVRNQNVVTGLSNIKNK